MNIAHNVERGRLHFPTKPAILFEERAITYQELDDAASRIVNVLAERGVRRGDRVALLLPNIPEFASAYLGIQKLGAVAVSLNVMLKKAEVRYILEDSGARTVITTAELRPGVPDAELDREPTILIAEGEAGDELSLGELMTRASPRAPTADMKPTDPAAILYTSGTTGFPKGATLSHGNVVSNIYATNRCTGMGPADRLHLYLPLFHCFGQNFILNAGLNACATLVMQRRYSPDNAVRALTVDGATMFFAVPTVLIDLLNAETPIEVFAGARYCFSAAAPLPVEIAQQWEEHFGHKVYEGYGLTETSPFASYNHDLRHKLGSIGTPIENVDMKVVDEQGAEVAPGEWGEIVVRGPNVMLGYWGRSQETAEAIRDGWFHSGDVGTRDEEGYFHICDRIKDMVITGGFNVYPAEVENVLHGHPAVAEAAVYGIADPRHGEVVAATVVLKKDAAAGGEDLDSFCRERLAAYKVPRRWEFAEAIPKGATGKVLKRVLRGDVHAAPQGAAHD